MLKPIDEFGMTERNGVALVSSRFVAETFKKRHDDVIGTIDKKILSLANGDTRTFSDINFIKSAYKDTQNRKQTEYLLTRDGFSFIVMGFTGRKADKFKIDYINRFNDMEAFIKSLQAAKFDFPAFTDAIMNAHEEPKHYHFSNEINMINKIVLGMTAKEFKVANGLDKAVVSIRPHLTSDQIFAIEMLQRIDIGLIVAISDFQQRKSILQQQYVLMGIRALDKGA